MTAAHRLGRVEAAADSVIEARADQFFNLCMGLLSGPDYGRLLDLFSDPGRWAAPEAADLTLLEEVLADPEARQLFESICPRMAP